MNTVTLLLASASSALLLLNIWSEYRRVVQQERNEERIMRSEKRIDGIADFVERIRKRGVK